MKRLFKIKPECGAFSDISNEPSWQLGIGVSFGKVRTTVRIGVGPYFVGFCIYCW